MPDRPFREAVPGRKTMPELNKLRAFDREQHIQRSMDAGLSREEAEKHAEEDMSERDDSQP